MARVSQVEHMAQSEESERPMNENEHRTFILYLYWPDTCQICLVISQSEDRGHKSLDQFM